MDFGKRGSLENAFREFIFRRIYRVSEKPLLPVSYVFLNSEGNVVEPLDKAMGKLLLNFLL